jgi:hypothetical protein
LIWVKSGKLAKDHAFADRLFAALCNVKWVCDGCSWSTTWREAGRILARLQGDQSERAYLEFYHHHWGQASAAIREGTVADDAPPRLPRSAGPGASGPPFTRKRLPPWKTAGASP